uniref:FBD domain-containing protein n=1 Tax=Panagrellus redivivus TaxID=6233 RepID=A0A7E4VC80_PANRE
MSELLLVEHNLKTLHFEFLIANEIDPTLFKEVALFLKAQPKGFHLDITSRIESFTKVDKYLDSDFVQSDSSDLSLHEYTRLVFTNSKLTHYYYLKM